MATRQDIQLSDNAIIIKDKNNGENNVHDYDFVFGNSDDQHIEDTINAFPGWWKETPADGVGVFSYLKSSGKELQLSRYIMLQLQNDGYQVNSPQIYFDGNGNLIISPNAKI